MKQRLSHYPIAIGILLIFILACKESGLKTGIKIDSLAITPIVLDTSNVSLVKKDTVPKDTTPTQKLTVGNIYYNLQYCGGARPTEEILTNLAAYKLLSKSTLKLKNKKREYLISTDDNGGFDVSIESGTYDVYLTTKINKLIYNVSLKNCEDCLTLPISSVTIISGNKTRIEITLRCGNEAKERP